MAKNFIKGALSGFIFGPLYSFIMWVILSAAISIEVLIVSVLLNWNGVSQVSLDVIINWDTSTLTSLPYFSLLDYIQIMWAGLLVPIIIAGGMYIIVLAQGTGTENRILNFFDVARRILLDMALLIMIWLAVGSFYAFYHDSTMLHDSSTQLGQFWLDIENQSRAGLGQVGLNSITDMWYLLMTTIFPYIPLPFFLLSYFYLFGSIHAGWIGNSWGVSS